MELNLEDCISDPSALVSAELLHDGKIVHAMNPEDEPDIYSFTLRNRRFCYLPGSHVIYNKSFHGPALQSLEHHDPELSDVIPEGEQELRARLAYLIGGADAELLSSDEHLYIEDLMEIILRHCSHLELIKCYAFDFKLTNNNPLDHVARMWLADDAVEVAPLVVQDLPVSSFINSSVMVKKISHVTLEAFFREPRAARHFMSFSVYRGKIRIDVNGDLTADKYLALVNLLLDIYQTVIGSPFGVPLDGTVDFALELKPISEEQEQRYLQYLRDLWRLASVFADVNIVTFDIKVDVHYQLN